MDDEPSEPSVSSIPLLPPDADFEYIQDVQWGPAPKDDGYASDQELAPRPRRERCGDPCGCRPLRDAVCCLDDSCILYACQEECRSNCTAGELCGNKRLTRRAFKPLQVIQAGPKGYGLTVLENCTKGDLITEYVGVAVKANALPRLFARYQLDRRLYIMALGDGIYIDAKQQGGLARYINHSCEPNCKVERWKVRGVLRAAVVALHDITAGTELSFDYQWERKRGRAPTKCHCGTKSCRGTLEVSKSLQEQGLQKQLEQHWTTTNLRDHTLVNRTIQIYSKEHSEYFLGEITEYNQNTQMHCVWYPHERNEAWEDLSKEDWKILDEKFDEKYIIAKKTQPRRASPTTSLLLLPNTSHLPSTRVQNYLYVQTHIKEAFWAKHLIERCERTCQVQIQAQQFARPPLPPDPNNPEDTEKFQALDKSSDGTVWKLTITGTDIVRARSILERNVAFLEKRFAESTPVAATATLTYEVIYPRLIADAVKRVFPNWQTKYKTVQLSFAPSESKSKQFSRIVLEGNVASDLVTTQEAIYNALLGLCQELNAPADARKSYVNLGLSGGTLTAEQFQLLCSTDRNHSIQGAHEDLSQSSFFLSFENRFQCSVWVQSLDDMGRIDSNNRIVGQGDANTPRKVYIACAPKDVTMRWAQIQSRVAEMERGVQFVYLGVDRIFQPLMSHSHFFDYVKFVTGATVSTDDLTGDHLRVDGRLQGAANLSDEAQEMTEKERASVAEELVRLQIELYRDHCIRDHSWIFGRDWTIINQRPDDDSKPVSFGQLDKKSTAQGCIEIAEIVAHLGLSGSVAVHAALILYRFMVVVHETQMKAREAVLACVFLANKCQKVVKWKKMENVLEAGYKVFYPGTVFDKKKKEVLVFEERVISAEIEILKTLQYDIFVDGIDWIKETAYLLYPEKKSNVEEVFQFAFSGQVLAAGCDLWLRYGARYVIAASATLLLDNVESFLNALSVIPMKVSQTAEIIAANAKLGRPTSKIVISHPILEGDRSVMKKRLPFIQKRCAQIMLNGVTTPVSMSFAPVATQRYQIVGQRSCRRRRIANISASIVNEKIFPHVDKIEAESTCSIYIGSSAESGFEDIVLEGQWRAIALAEHLLRSLVESLPDSVDTPAVKDKARMQSKAEPCLLTASDILTSDGWDGTIMHTSCKEAYGLRVGGKSCIAAKTSEASLRESGLRWWIPPKYGPSPSGAVNEMFLVRFDPSNQLDLLGILAKSLVGKSKQFPKLTSRLVKKLDGAGDRSIAISLQRWPSEKVASKEDERTRKGKSMGIGFSPAALQEMQLLRQLHSLIPSPMGHPNIVLPVSIAVPKDEVKPNKDMEVTSNYSESSMIDDPIFSLFRSTVDNEKAAVKDKHVKEHPHLVFHPTPFVLHRFISKKKRDGEELEVGPSIIMGWFHDLLSALVHCHSNHVILRTIQPDQIIIDQCGTAKLGAFYRGTVLAPDEQSVSFGNLEGSKSEKSKDDDHDVSRDPYAAPEILLGYPKHSKASDVWSMGCLLANLLLQKPLFTAKDRPSLLTAIYKIVGTPAVSNFEEAVKLPHYFKPAKKYPPGIDRAITHMAKGESSVSDKAIDLLSRMLHLDPSQRCSADEALSHDFMVEYIENCETNAFRQQYITEWIGLKGQMARRIQTNNDTVKGIKRKAMLMAVSAKNAEDDDLYDLDDLLGDTPLKKTKR